MGIEGVVGVVVVGGCPCASLAVGIIISLMTTGAGDSNGTGAFSHPEGTDVTSFSSRIAHVLQTSHMREHTLTHHRVCTLFLCVCLSACVCVCTRVVSQWPHVCVCMDGSHHDSERTGLFLQGRTGGKGQMLVCVKICLSDGYKLQFSGGYLLVKETACAWIKAPVA